MFIDGKTNMLSAVNQKRTNTAWYHLDVESRCWTLKHKVWNYTERVGTRKRKNGRFLSKGTLPERQEEYVWYCGTQQGTLVSNTVLYISKKTNSKLQMLYH